MKKLVSAILATFTFFLFAPAVMAADTKAPSDVPDFKGQSLDLAAKLSWGKATDDVGVEGYVIYYGTNSVNAKGQKYELNKDVKNVQEFTITELKNGTKYYFSVIAYDAAGNESLNWATEVSVTPGVNSATDASKDKDAPQVAAAEALNVQEVKVVFNEAIVLPEEDAEDAFDLEDQDKFESLLVTEAKLDGGDEAGKTVILTTAKQKENVEYKLTASIDIKDKAGNPIISGTSDTAIFKGSAKEKLQEDTTGPSLVKVEIVNNTNIIVNFDETIILSIDPSEDFEIVAEEDKSKKLNVLGVKLGNNTAGVEDASAVITTSPQEKIKYTVKAVKLKDEAGNEVNAEKNSSVFEGVEPTKIEDDGGGATDKDLVAPKDVVQFFADKVANAKKYIVKLKWMIPAENKDTKEQLIYKSTDKGKNYKKEASLDNSKTNYEIKDLEPGEYWFKLTQKDEAGNESKGVVTKVILSKTGPGVIGLLAFSLLAGRVVVRRRK